MHGRFGILLALASLVVADSALLAQRRGSEAGRPGWLSSLEDGKAQARKTGKPLMVVFRCEP